MQRREDWRAALIAHTVYSVNRTRKDKKLKITDFMPQEDKGPPRQTKEQQKEAILAWKQHIKALGSKRK